MKTGISAGLLAFCLLCVNPVARAAPAALPQETAPVPVLLLVDLGSGQRLAARAPERAFAPASVTKVMTAYVAFQELAKGTMRTDARFTVSPEIASAWHGRGTSLYLLAGDTLSADTLLHGIATVSANDASVVLAQGHAGTIERWTALMNAEARRLGMTGSHFQTANGWPDGGKTFVTAADLVKLASAILDTHPAFYRRYFGQKRMTWNGRTQESHDPITGLVPGADGIKTGFTREAGYNFLGSAERDGRRLVMVVGGAKSEGERAAASRALMEWGFTAWKKRPLFEKDTVVTSARVQDGATRKVPLKTRKAIYATLPAAGDSAVRLRVIYEGPLVAPVKAGDHVADLEITVAGQQPGLVPLYAAKPVEKAGAFDRIVNGLMELFG